MKITKNTDIFQLAAIVSLALAKAGLSATLVGGAVVTIYTDNLYMSHDLDFISPDDHRRIEDVMTGLGFTRKGRSFAHKLIPYTVEFPQGPIGIGGRVPVKPEGKKKIHGATVTLLSPTQSAMDRLAWFYFSNDRQCLDQAVMLAKAQKINLGEVKKWSLEEGMGEKYEVFLNLLKKIT